MELPARCDGLELFHSALEEKISIAPGNLFSLSGGLQRFIRLNGGAAGDSPRVGAALQTLGRLVAGQLAAT